MALTEYYANFDLTTGLNDGTSEANAWQSWSAVDSSGISGPARINVKKMASPYEISTTETYSTLAGTATAPLIIEGYETTIGDGGYFDMVSTSSLTDLSLDWDNAWVRRFRFLTTDPLLSNEGFSLGGRNCTAEDCIIQGGRDILAQNVINCALRGRTRVAQQGADAGLVINSYIEATLSGGEAIFFDLFNNQSVVANSVIVGPGSGAGISIRRANDNGPMYILGNTFYNFQDGVRISDYIDASSDRERMVIIGNVFSTMSRNGIHRDPTRDNGTSIWPGQIYNNIYHLCTSGPHNLGDHPDYESFNSSQLLSQLFADAVGRNFTPAAGSDLLNAGVSKIGPAW